MKLAFLTPEYPHPTVSHSGGLGTSIKNLVQELVKEGIAVTVFVYGQKKSLVFEENSITFHLIENRNYNFGKWFFYRKFINNYINRVVSETGIQLLEVPDWTGITAFMKFKIPIVMRFHGSDTYFCALENRPQKWKNKWFERLAVSGADSYIAPTNFAGQLSSKLFNLPILQVRTIPYGLQLEAFENSNPDLYSQGMILYIGTLIRKKGVFELPEIFERIKVKCPDAKLVLIGPDSIDVHTKTSTWSILKSIFSPDLIKDVSYLGKIPYLEVKDAIKKANVCVFPTYAETLGLVTIESMAMQKAVVNSSIGWAQELMEDGISGYLVHPSNHDLYASRIISLLQDPVFVREMGIQAHKFVAAKFDSKLIVLQNIEFYQSLLS